MKPFRFSVLAFAIGMTPLAAHAQDATWNFPYGTFSSENTGWENPHRDGNGNLEVVNGIIQSGSGSHSTLAQVGAGMGGGAGNSGVGVGVSNATAYGNQLNVVTSGKFNTVIVNSTQINNGDVVAAAGTQVGQGGEDDQG